MMSCFVVRAAARRLHERARSILPFRTWSRLRKPVTGIGIVYPHEQSGCFYAVLRYPSESARALIRKKNLTRIARS
jgi:hypothetical protein